MRITEMRFDGKKGHAVARRDGEHVVVVVTTAGGDRTHHVQANDAEDVWSMAECLQETLDGFRGCGGDIRSYFLPLELIAEV